MKPYMPKNAYEVVVIREEIKNCLEELERIKPDEYGAVLVDKGSMITIKGKLLQGILFADCLLCLMYFNEEGEKE